LERAASARRRRRVVVGGGGGGCRGCRDRGGAAIVAARDGANRGGGRGGNDCGTVAAPVGGGDGDRRGRGGVPSHFEPRAAHGARHQRERAAAGNRRERAAKLHQGVLHRAGDCRAHPGAWGGTPPLVRARAHGRGGGGK